MTLMIDSIDIHRETLAKCNTLQNIQLYYQEDLETNLFVNRYLQYWLEKLEVAHPKDQTIIIDDHSRKNQASWMYMFWVISNASKDVQRSSNFLFVVEILCLINHLENIILFLVH